MEKTISGKTGIAYIALLIVFFLWGSVYVANGYILQSLSPIELACCRFAVAAIALGGAVVRLRTSRPRKEKIHVEKKDWKTFLRIGFIGYFFSIECAMLSIQWTGASMASLINSLNPVIISVFAAFFLKEKLTVKKIFCLALGLLGVLVVSGGPSAEPGQLTGVLWGMGSITTWAWAVMYVRRLSDRYDALMITFLVITISLLFHIPTAAIEVAVKGMPVIHPMTVICIFYSGICGTAIPQFLWSFALSKLPASTCSMFYPLMPVFSALLGVMLLGESLSSRFFVGGAMIVSTVIISCLPDKRGSREQKPSQKPQG
ncbi:MAG: DMT family transporter [Bacillota bacterium]|nr:DMT family transporter [Bacillota bacterium]